MTVPAAPQAKPVRPFAPFEWALARRYLAATRKGAGVSLISVIAFGGIMLAVAVLIVVMSVMQGFRTELLNQLLGLNGHVFVRAYGEPITDYDVMAQRIAEVPGVVRASPLIESPVYVAAEHGESGAVVRGMRKQDLMNLKVVSDRIVDGSLDHFGEKVDGAWDIAVGSRLAAELGVRAGDPVTLISGAGAETAFGPTIRKKTYRVGAVFEIGMSEYDKVFMFMPLEQAQLFFDMKDAAQSIEVRVDDPDKIDQYKPAIMKAAGPNLQIVDWRKVNQSFFNALQIERGMVRIILMLLVLIAALNIITGLVMLVKDKTGDIAVLRTMGATQGAVMRIFFLSGSLIGVLGTLAGVVLGIAFTLNIASLELFLSHTFGIRLFSPDIYFFSEVPAEVQPSEVIRAATWAFAMSCVATIYPAWRAARLDPVEALRYE